MKIETTNDIMEATREELIDYALDVTSERNDIKAENAELKARLEKAVELPCMVMIQQTIDERGNYINTNKAQAFNGRYGVLYIDRQKWKLPLIDICTEKVYNSKAAEARLKELEEQNK